jgi:2-polyprenyl-3-methyl-5-hydroxy-6-metoxy-1,4-benzoquinol methylase
VRRVRDNPALLTTESIELITPYLPAPPARILEVGCGAGELAGALQQRGYDVLALDSSVENVDHARARGVNATVAHWPDFVDLPFEVILFTRSLHHIQPVTGALRRAHELLHVGGVLLIEDFAFHHADARTISWFKNVVDVLDAAGVLNHEDGRFASRIAQADNALEAWHLDDVVDVAQAVELHAAIQGLFSIRTIRQLPHLYRYIAQVATEPARDATVSAVLKSERLAHTVRLIDYLGRFWAASKDR